MQRNTVGGLWLEEFSSGLFLCDAERFQIPLENLAVDQRHLVDFINGLSFFRQLLKLCQAKTATKKPSQNRPAMPSLFLEGHASRLCNG